MRGPYSLFPLAKIEAINALLARTLLKEKKSNLGMMVLVGKTMCSF